MPDHPKVPLSSVLPRASPEAISLMEWMLQYNPKKRPRPNQLLQHEFFTPKVLGSSLQNKQSSSQKETSAETPNQSRVESIVIGTNSLQMKTKVVEFASPSPLPVNKQASFEETPHKKKAMNKSIDV